MAKNNMGEDKFGLSKIDNCIMKKEIFRMWMTVCREMIEEVASEVLWDELMLREDGVEMVDGEHGPANDEAEDAQSY